MCITYIIQYVHVENKNDVVYFITNDMQVSKIVEIENRNNSCIFRTLQEMINFCIRNLKHKRY